MYKVPMEIPKHCNECPFGRCQYNKPFWSDEEVLNPIDLKSNIKNTYGCVCNIDFNENGKYTQVLRSQIGKDIERPDWCKLIDIDMEDNKYDGNKM